MMSSQPYVKQVTNKVPTTSSPARKRARVQVSLPYSNAVPPLSFFTRSRPSIPINPRRSEGSLAAENHARRWTATKLINRPGFRCQDITIDILPSDVLLAIFVFYMNEGKRTKKEMEAWQSLAHVCRRWRGVVFGSPLRLNLRLFCTAKTRARDTLEVWPPLPLFIQCYGDYPKECVDNIIAALERHNHVHQIKLMDVPSSYLEKVVAAMREPFPELTNLLLWSGGKMMTDLPDSFLGGSAPRLQSLWLDGIPYPGLPKLLLSATHLVHLNLWNVPHSGYISPEAIVIAVSALTSLTSLWLQFQSPRSRPDRASRRPPPATYTVFPALTSFFFKGVAEYLDDLVARICAPRLNDLSITFFNQIVFDTPQLIQFVNRTPMLKAQEEACISFGNDTASVNLSSRSSDYGWLSVEVSCNALEWQVSSLEQVCRLCLPPFSTLEVLYVYDRQNWPRHWQDVEDSLWLELLHPFTAVKSLYISKQFAPRIASALQGLDAGRMADLLPTLQNIFLEEHVNLQHFVFRRWILRGAIGAIVGVRLWY